MKILHLVPAMEQGGVETVVLNLNRAVVANGWKNVVVSKGGRLVERIEREGGRHVALDVKSKNPLTYFARAKALARVLRIERPDLVCAHSRVPAWLFVWANRRLGIRWVTCAHGANSVSRYSEVMTKGDLTVVPSHFLADYLKAHYAIDDTRLRVVNPSVDADRFDPTRLDAAFVDSRRRAWGIGPDDFVVMTVGRLSPVKGYDMLLRAAAKLAPDVRRLRLVLVGDADAGHLEYREALQREAETLGFAVRGASDAARPAASDSPSVIFAGGESKIPECLSLASVVVSANTRKPESFGLSMAEALMMDRPVVAQAFGGALDVVRDGLDGVLVPPGDEPGAVDRFAAALRRVRTTSFAGLRTRAQERFSQNVTAAKFVVVCREALGADAGNGAAS